MERFHGCDMAPHLTAAFISGSCSNKCYYLVTSGTFLVAVGVNKQLPRAAARKQRIALFQ